MAAVSAGILPRLIQMMQYGNPKLQFEACWVLTNVASGTPEQVFTWLTLVHLLVVWGGVKGAIGGRVVADGGM